MTITSPPPVPQLPIRDMAEAIAFYKTKLGFTLDWKYEDRLAGVSRDQTVLFLDLVTEGPLHPVRVWLNLYSIAEVVGLHDDWQRAGVLIIASPEQKPWGLFEFIAEDCSGNTFRVYYDTESPPVDGLGEAPPNRR